MKRRYMPFSIRHTPYLWAVWCLERVAWLLRLPSRLALPVLRWIDRVGNQLYHRATERETRAFEANLKAGWDAMEREA